MPSVVLSQRRDKCLMGCLLGLCFEEMQSEGVLPNAVTYACILKACATIRAIEQRKLIHDEIARQGLLHHNTVRGGALVDMYVKCGVVRQLLSSNVIIVIGFGRK